MSTATTHLTALAASWRRHADLTRCATTATALDLCACQVDALVQRILDGDIGEEQETIEVLPEEAPLTVPVPPVPVPA